MDFWLVVILFFVCHIVLDLQQSATRFKSDERALGNILMVGVKCSPQVGLESVLTYVLHHRSSSSSPTHLELNTRPVKQYRVLMNYMRVVL